MQALAKAIHAKKKHYKHLLLLSALFVLLPGIAQATSLETRPQKLQHQTTEGLLPKQYLLQNPLVALITVSDYSKSEISSLPFVIKDEQILQKIFQNKYHYTTITPCKKLNYTVGKRKFRELLRNISDNLGQNLQHDGLIFVYNGHGESGTVMLSDGQSYSMAKICATFDNETLDNWVGKPRIIIKLACRGGNTGQGILYPQPKTPTKEKIWHCQDQDFINIYANTDGNLVNECIDPNNKNKGSAFVETFNELTNLNTTFQSNLDEILGMLGQQVSKIMQGTECIEWKKTFFGTLYLAKGHHSQHNEEQKSPDEEPTPKPTKQKVTTLQQNFDEELSLDLCDAIDDNEYTLAQELINNPQVNINIKEEDEDGLTPLLRACLNGDTSLNITKLLLDHPYIDINLTDKYHRNPLHHISLQGAIKSLELLLKQPTIHQIINQQDYQKKTPLDILFDQITGQKPDKKHVTAWNMLVAKGAILNIHTKNYQQLNPNHFKEPQKNYVHIIKQNPTKNLLPKNKKQEKTNNKTIEDLKDDLVDIEILSENPKNFNLDKEAKRTNKIIEDQDEQKNPEETITQDLDDEKDPDEPIIEDTKQEKKTDKPSFDVEKLQYLLKTAIEEVEKSEKQLQTNDMAYFYSNTGAGKSTIINYLLGNELEKYYPEEEKNFKIRLKDPNAIGPKIGQNDVQSETTYPCPYFQKNQTKPLGYCDTAGFSDVRGIENIVCSYIGNNLIINKTNKLKAICFLTTKDALNVSRGQPFLNSVISTISNLIKETKEFNLLDSIFIVLNNKSHIDNARLVEEVFAMLNDFRQGFKKKKKTDLQNAPKYENYTKILKKILKDSSKIETNRILAINPLDDGTSRKKFLDRISTSPIIPKKNLKKLASKQGEEKVRWLQKEVVQQTEPILDRILAEKKNIKEKETRISKLSLQIQKLKKELQTLNTTINDFQNQSRDIEKKQQELKEKITNTKKEQQEIKNKIDELNQNTTSSDYSKETEKLLSQYDHMINNQKERISKLEKKQNDIHTEIKRYQHKIEDKKEQIDELGLQLKKEQQKIDQLNKEKKHLLDNTTQERIIALAKKQKNWFDHYQQWLTPINHHWAKTMLQPNIFQEPKKQIYTQLQACNSTCRTLQEHTLLVESVAFNPKGTLLASASGDNTIKLWNTTNWQCTKTLQGHTSSVWSVAFNPQGTLLASASLDKTIKLWNTTNGQCTKTLQWHTNSVCSVAFNPQGHLLASVEEEEVSLCKQRIIKIWNTTNWQGTKTLNGHTSYVSSVVFNPQGNLLASASWDKTIKLWDTTNWQCKKTLNGHTDWVNSVAFNPQGDLLASASNDKTIKLWDTTNWQCKKTLNGHTDWVNSVAFNPQGDLLASASNDKTIKLWNTTNGQCTKTLKGHTEPVQSVAFNPQGTLLASASCDKTIKLWDIPTLLGHKTSKYYLFNLDTDQFKLKTDPHLKKITEILNHYYKDTVQGLQNSDAQKKTKTFQTHITNLQKKIEEQKQEKTNLQKEIDSLNSKIDDLENKKLQQIQTQIKNKKTKDQLAQLTQQKEKIDTILHNLQQDHTKKTEIFNKLDRQRFQAETKHEYLIKAFNKEQQIHENLSNEFKRHEEDLKNYEGMLERKQPSIELILKIDKIVPMGLIAYSFIQKYMQCKTNNKHM